MSNVLLPQFIAWGRAHQASVLRFARCWLLGSVVVLLGSLVRGGWTRREGLTLSFGIDSSTITLLIIALLPVVLALVLLVGGTFKAAGVEFKVESVVAVIASLEDVLRQGTGDQRAELESVRRQLEQVAGESIEHAGNASGLLALGRRYGELRRQTPSGAVRTAEMTKLVVLMRATAVAARPGDREVLRWLESDDAGLRLLGAALARDRAKVDFFGPLLHQVADPRSAFEQYHALVAIEQLVPQLGPEQRKELITVLLDQRQYDEARRRWIAPNSDRWFLSQRLLQRLAET
jgi:hypothetical protein